MSAPMPTPATVDTIIEAAKSLAARHRLVKPDGSIVCWTCKVREPVLPNLVCPTCRAKAEADALAEAQRPPPPVQRKLFGYDS